MSFIDNVNSLRIAIVNLIFVIISLCIFDTKFYKVMIYYIQDVLILRIPLTPSNTLTNCIYLLCVLVFFLK